MAPKGKSNPSKKQVLEQRAVGKDEIALLAADATFKGCTTADIAFLCQHLGITLQGRYNVNKQCFTRYYKDDAIPRIIQHLKSCLLTLPLDTIRCSIGKPLYRLPIPSSGDIKNLIIILKLILFLTN